MHRKYMAVVFNFGQIAKIPQGTNAGKHVILVPLIKDWKKKTSWDQCSFFMKSSFFSAYSLKARAIEISDQNTLVVASCTPSPHNLPILTHLSNFNRKICIAVVESANEPRDGTVKSVAPFSFTLLFSSTFANGIIIEPPPIYHRPRKFIVHNSSL